MTFYSIDIVISILLIIYTHVYYIYLCMWGEGAVFLHIIEASQCVFIYLSVLVKRTIRYIHQIVFRLLNNMTYIRVFVNQ